MLRLPTLGASAAASSSTTAFHAHVLDESLRAAGTALGSDVHNFVDHLLNRKPVSVGIIGASVAQNAGCLTQPGRRCMNYRGVDDVRLVWGTPRSRPFKGFLVRWFEWLNATWPHPEHTLSNSGRDAQPIWALLPCIYSYVPPAANLIFLEVGSMPYAFDPVRAESVVRRLANLNPRPTIVFVTVTIWCTCQPLCRNFKAHGVTQLPHFKSRNLLNETERPIPHVEKNVAKICRHYGVSCISMRDALNEPAFAGRPGFSIPELAGDCLHPTSGTRGVDYVTDMVIHWTQRAVAQRIAARNSRAAIAEPLPSAIHPVAAKLKNNPGVCFDLEALGSRGISNGQHLLAVPWRTAFCPTASALTNSTRASSAETAASDAAQAGCSRWDERPEDCSPSSLKTAASVLASPPSVWFYCGFALSPSQKASPGVVALVPGAQLYLPLDVSLAGASTGRTLVIALLHLRSYEGMGIAILRCVAGCSCPSHRIDAHEPPEPAKRNESVYGEYDFRVQVAEQSYGCLLALRLDEESSSGGFKFKVRSITARAAVACETRSSQAAC